MATFYYHPTSLDSNGNHGPSKNDPGWIKVEIEDPDASLDEVAKELPKEAQEHIAHQLHEYHSDDDDEGYNVCNSCGELDCYRIDCYIANTAGWAAGFTLVPESDWKEMEG